MPLNILVVDDDEIDVEAIRRAFRKANVTNPLCIARDGLEALEILTGKDGLPKVTQPCLILLDINMPRMNGFELLQELRKDEKLKNNVVFILSTSGRNEDKMMAYGFNAAGYFLKEDLDNVAQTLRQYCQTSRFPEIK